MTDDEHNRTIEINLDGRVGYRVSIRGSKAAKSRLGQCIIDYDILVTSHYRPTGGYIVLKLFADPGEIDDIADDLKATNVEYSGPTYFENGSITQIYDSPEDELAGEQSNHYLAYLERRREDRRDRGVPADTREMCRLLYRMVVDRSSVEVSADTFAQWLMIHGWERVDSAQRSSDDIGYLKDSKRIWLTPGAPISPRAMTTAAEVEGTSTADIVLELRAGLESIDDIKGVPSG